MNRRKRLENLVDSGPLEVFDQQETLTNEVENNDKTNRTALQA